MKKENKPTYCRLQDSNIIYILKGTKDGIAKLLFKNKTLLVNEEKILILENYIPSKQESHNPNYFFNPSNVKNEKLNNNEVMLRMLTVDEAIPLLDKFIDNAVILKLPSVKIIHGKKGGVIRRAVHDYLDKCEFIDGYTYAEYYDGSYGATVAKIKR